MSDTNPELLVVVLDTNSLYWGQMEKNTQSDSNKHITFSNFIKSFLVFLNAYTMLERNGLLAIISNNSNSTLIFPSSNKGKDVPIYTNDLFRADTSVVGKLKAMEIYGAGSCLDVCLSTGLCYINRVKKLVPNVNPRILVLQGSTEESHQYTPVMNCVFAAQKLSVPIDTYIVSNNDHSQLQQAAVLTGGVYIKPKEHKAFTQYLMTMFLPDRDSRSRFLLPNTESVSFKGSCFCCEPSKLISVGFVCSVCLAIYCNAPDKCTQCDTVGVAKFKKQKV